MDVFDISEINESEGDHVSAFGVLVDCDHGGSNVNGGCVIA